ncbi:MAG: carboxypeptidase-like regulatory domain-containing protein, partial [Gemmatimonadaceae bacterium]
MMRFGVRAAVLLIAALAGRLNAQRETDRLTRIEGRVLDRIGGGVLAGAKVQLAPEIRTPEGRVFGVQAESDGRYRIDSVSAGNYLATFSHPFLDSLGIEAPVVRVVVRSSDVLRLDLGTPPRDKIIRALCPAGSMGDSTALFLGHVRDARTGMPLPGASVRIRWTELVLGKGVVERE